MKNKTEDKHDEPIAFERIRKIGRRVADLKSGGFNEGHEALIRFLDDLREHMGWPSSDTDAPGRASVDFKAKSGGDSPALWNITMGGKQIAKVDLSDYDPPKDALEDAAKRIGAALYHEAWNWK